ncbi:MAG: hypothetical protein B7Y31_14035 [Novosphingobium sp. 16-62-11]|nr:MAG: hypothetical protein B7Y31_14035 [Novosphingobium sp. 16-62-11]
MPDLTVLLAVRPEVSAARLALRDGDVTDRIEGRGADYHARVAAAFRAFAETEPERFAIVDAEGSPDNVHRRVLAVVAGLLS